MQPTPRPTRPKGKKSAIVEGRPDVPRTWVTESRQDALLDQALEETFPASDSISPMLIA